MSRARSSKTIECRFTLKRVRDMIIIYSYCHEDREIKYVIKDKEVTRTFRNEKLQEHFGDHCYYLKYYLTILYIYVDYES